jgi:hypothetical protein
VEGAFLQGVLRKCAFFSWFFVVKLWWIAGESWCVDGHFFVSENVLTFSTLFLFYCFVFEIGGTPQRLA